MTRAKQQQLWLKTKLYFTTVMYNLHIRVKGVFTSKITLGY